MKALGRGFSGAPFNKFSIILAANNGIQISVVCISFSSLLFVAMQLTRNGLVPTALENVDISFISIQLARKEKHSRILILVVTCPKIGNLHLRSYVVLITWQFV